ncbi:MAG: amidohydrolase family protein [Lachnospiraceae bacterium]|nr:amidohydrolase family protein [Lachnospiraceae bacterium]
MHIYHAEGVIHTPVQDCFEIHENAYVCVEEDGTVNGIYDCLPQSMLSIPVTDLGSRILIPAFTDGHIHSAQLPNAGLGYNMPFSQWLTDLTYPSERRYEVEEIYTAVNSQLIMDFWKNGIIHGTVMSSTDYGATENLFEQYIDSGMCAFIGKMNSDLPTYGVAAESTAVSIRDTERLVLKYANKNPNVNYAVSPEFVPTCSDELMEFLGHIAQTYKLPVITHAAEGAEDVEMVKKRFPGLQTYGNVLKHFELFGGHPSAAIHYNLATSQELRDMAEMGIVYIQCPNSGMDMGTEKLMPLRKALNCGVPCALGSDIAGGHTCNMFRIMISAMQLSRIISLYEPYEPLTLAEVFYLATKGGGRLFGKTGSFEAGYFFDALVLDDRKICPFKAENLMNRFEKIIYAADPSCITMRFCKGKEVPAPKNLK